MIAPAMKTRQDELLVYRELARRRAKISRRLDEASLPRWSALTQDEWMVEVELEFSLDDTGLAWVHGDFVARAGVLCQRCLEVLNTGYAGSVALCIVSDDARAAELAQTCDVLLATGDELAIADIIEDELLLAIPEQLCSEEPCERQPVMTYPADDEPAEAPAGPFAVLSKLKTE